MIDGIISMGLAFALIIQWAAGAGCVLSALFGDEEKKTQRYAAGAAYYAGACLAALGLKR